MEPRPKVEEIRACRGSNWMALFKGKTLKARAIELPGDLVEWLKKGNFSLADRFFPHQESSSSIITEIFDEPAVPEAVSDNESEECEPQKTLEWADFEELFDRIEQTIKELNGEVIPKLDWSSPRDAMWLVGNTLKCSCVGEIMILLKSSDSITHDLFHAYDNCEDLDQENQSHQADPVHLILREFFSINQSMEFRCFVKSSKLIGVSQRHHETQYDFLEDQKEETADLIHAFIEANVTGRFPLDRYVLDVYVDKKKRVWVVDFNPWSGVTDGLLFEWKELIEKDADDGRVEVRIAGWQSGRRPLGSFGVVDDFINVSSEEGLELLVRMQRQQEEEEKKLKRQQKQQQDQQ